MGSSSSAAAWTAQYISILSVHRSQCHANMQLDPCNWIKSKLAGVSAGGWVGRSLKWPACSRSQRGRSTNGREANDSAWPLVSTHVPGRSGRECRDRWKMIQDIDDNSGWLHTLATRPVSHAEAAEAMIHAHQAAALAAAATADSSDEEEADSSARARCCISGCRHQLLSCFGQVRGGSAIGGAAESHFVCAPCLYRWFASEAALQQEGGVRPHSRRTCPVCKAQLRASSSAIRGDADRYLMGLLKVEETWT